MLQYKLLCSIAIFLLSVSDSRETSLQHGNSSLILNNKRFMQSNMSNVIDTMPTTMTMMGKEKNAIMKQLESPFKEPEEDRDCRSGEQIRLCLSQMREDRRDTSEFTRSLEVSCCIYAKFMDCMSPLIPDCSNETVALIQTTIGKEFRVYDGSCLQYEYPSARCWIFFHQWCFFSLVFVSLTAFGILLAAVATKESRRRQRVRTTRNVMTMNRVNDSKPHMEFPPPPSYQECVEHRV